MRESRFRRFRPGGPHLSACRPGSWTPVGLAMAVLLAGCHCPHPNLVVSPAATEPAAPAMEPAAVDSPVQQPSCRPVATDAVADPAPVPQASRLFPVSELAVISLPQRHPGNGASLEAQLTTVRDLGPDATILVGSADVTRGGLQTAAGDLWLPSADLPTRTITFPGTLPASATSHGAIVGDDGACLLVNAATFQNYLPLELEWLRRQLNAIKPTQSLILVTNAPVWTFADSPGWLAARPLLRDFSGRCTVVMGGAERHSWWQSDGIEFLALGPPRDGADAGAVYGAQTDGVLWISMRSGKPKLQIVRPDLLVRMEAFARARQEQLKDLQEALTCTPAVGGPPATTATCRNPTNIPLTFQVVWSFDDPRVKVKPDVREFTLAPGEVFRQPFSLLHPGAEPLRFSRPRLHLRTALPGGADGIVPVELSATVRCPMSVDIPFITAANRQEGRVKSWAGRPLSITHPTQVFAGAEHWANAADASALVDLGHDHTALYVRITVRDDVVTSADRVTLLASPGGAAVQEPAAQVTMGANGTLIALESIRGGDPAIWAQALPGGYSLELVLPLAALGGGPEKHEIRLDVVVIDQDDGDGATKLMYSGHALPSSRDMLARCRLKPQAPEASAPAATGAE